MNDPIFERFKVTAEVVAGFFSDRMEGTSGVGFCIEGNRWLCALLEQDGITARPFAVRADIVNHAYARFIESLSSNPTAKPPADAYWQTIGAEDDEEFGRVASGGWDGHLVAIVDLNYLIDVSIGLHSRPQNDLILEPLAVRVADKHFLHGDGGLTLTLPKANIVYQPRRNDVSWRSTEAWQTRPNRDGMRMMRAKIADQLEQTRKSIKT